MKAAWPAIRSAFSPDAMRAWSPKAKLNLALAFVVVAVVTYLLVATR